MNHKLNISLAGCTPYSVPARARSGFARFQQTSQIHASQEVPDAVL